MIKNHFRNLLQNFEVRFKNSLVTKLGHFNCYNLQLSFRFQSIFLMLNRILWISMGTLLWLKQSLLNNIFVIQLITWLNVYWNLLSCTIMRYMHPSVLSLFIILCIILSIHTKPQNVFNKILFIVSL